jgi:hypothetical protein
MVMVGDDGGGARDRREGDGAQGDEALEGAEGNGDNFGIFCAQHMKDGRVRHSLCESSVGLSRYRSQGVVLDNK